MAATRLIALHVNKGRSVAGSLADRTDYAKNPEKTEKGELVTSYCCDPMTVDEEFMLQKRQYHQITGRSQKDDLISSCTDNARWEQRSDISCVKLFLTIRGIFPHHCHNNAILGQIRK